MNQLSVVDNSDDIMRRISLAMESSSSFTTAWFSKATKAVCRVKNQQPSTHSELEITSEHLNVDDVDGLEQQLTFERLCTLEKQFAEADVDGGGGLDMEEFRNAMRNTLGRGLDDKALDVIFMKVDTNCDGHVDWDEYLSYMLLEYRERDHMRVTNTLRPLPQKAHGVPSMIRYQRFHDSFVSIVYWPATIRNEHNLHSPQWHQPGRYITVTQDGVVNFWNMALQHQRQNHIPSNTSQKVWVTDMAMLAVANRLVVSTTSCDLLFFDLTPLQFYATLRIKNLEISVSRLYLWQDSQSIDHVVIIWGDCRGNICVVEFGNCKTMCVLTNHSTSAKGREVTFDQVMGGELCGVKGYKISGVHNDFVIQLLYVPNLFPGAFLSCARTEDTALCMADIHGRRRSYFHVAKGVYCFDYSKSHNLIVTAGKDAVVRVWNPYVTHQPIMVLQGHKSAVMYLIVDQTAEQIISISDTKEIIIFDMNTQISVQHITRKFVSLGKRPISAIYYNASRKALLLGSNQLAVFEHSEVSEVKHSLVSHPGHVTCILYNSLFETVVSADSTSMVRVWDIYTGTNIMQFKAHTSCLPSGEVLDIEITAMSFDPSQRRLITASREGSVRIWNFNNGALLTELAAVDKEEITGIVCPRGHIVTAGWGKRVTVYMDSQEDHSYSTWQRRHKDDILSVAFCPPSTITTAAYNGDIILWSLETGAVMSVINVFLSSRPMALPTYLQRAGYSAHDSAKDTTAQDVSHARVAQRYRRRRGAKLFAEKDLKHKVDNSLPTLVRNSFHERTERINEAAVEQLLFLGARNQRDNTAVLVAAGAQGWIRFWSLSHKTGLIGQFNGCNVPNEAIISLATDPDNEYLLTGDTQGYIKVWDIMDYCIDHETPLSSAILTERLEKQKQIFPFISVSKDNTMRSRKLAQHKHRRPPPCSKPEKTLRLPTLLTSLRGHMQGVCSLQFVPEENLILSASADRSIRMWTITGEFKGVFDQAIPWSFDKNLAPGARFVAEPDTNIPTDLSRVASAATLKVLNKGSQPHWLLTKHIVLNIMPRMRRQGKMAAEKKPDTPITAKRKPERKPKQDAGDMALSIKVDMTAPRGGSKILGKALEIPRRHQRLPRLSGVREFHTQVAVYSSLPCHDLQDVENPELLQALKHRNTRKVVTMSTEMTAETRQKAMQQVLPRVV